MANEFVLGRPDQIPLGEGRAFKVGDEKIAVFRTRAGGVYAIQAICPHLGGPLADGLVGDATVICPLHERTFDLRTGAGVGCDESLRQFPLRIDGDGVMHVSIG